jgi:hypothetical protein
MKPLFARAEQNKGYSQKRGCHNQMTTPQISFTHAKSLNIAVYTIHIKQFGNCSIIIDVHPGF